MVQLVPQVELLLASLKSHTRNLWEVTSLRAPRVQSIQLLPGECLRLVVCNEFLYRGLADFRALIHQVVASLVRNVKDRHAGLLFRAWVRHLQHRTNPLGQALLVCAHHEGKFWLIFARCFCLVQVDLGKGSQGRLQSLLLFGTTALTEDQHRCYFIDGAWPFLQLLNWLRQPRKLTACRIAGYGRPAILVDDREVGRIHDDK
mmetsp:Transcript_104919/g.186618  ORF Transcript_104919/g.186618 Transcript_104919/m.186618 type:complete len:203 (+) Transcript_104919:338-946(+)